MSFILIGAPFWNVLSLWPRETLCTSLHVSARLSLKHSPSAVLRLRAALITRHTDPSLAEGGVPGLKPSSGRFSSGFSVKEELRGERRRHCRPVDTRQDEPSPKTRLLNQVNLNWGQKYCSWIQRVVVCCVRGAFTVSLSLFGCGICPSPPVWTI